MACIQIVRVPLCNLCQEIHPSSIDKNVVGTLAVIGFHDWSDEFRIYFLTFIISKYFLQIYIKVLVSIP